MAQLRKRGPDQFQARVRIKGTPEVSRTFCTKLEASQWAEETERLVKAGSGPSLLAANKLSLHNALDRYANEVTPSKKGKQQELVRLRRWQKQAIAQRPISQVRGSDLASYRDHRFEQGVGANTVRLELALISHLYEVAIKDWGLDTLVNPVKAIRKPKLPRGRERRLRDGEEEQLLSYCERTRSYHLRLVIVLAIETAMRRGEICGLHWTDIDLPRRLIRLHDTKNGDARKVPLSTRAVQELQPYLLRTDDALIHLHRDNITSAFSHACRACGICGLTLHDLRHEATSRLFEKGFNMMEVAAITGHKTLTMLKRYTHLDTANLLDRLD